ncbi:MAG: RHS repeat-associated core domain-containing protein, partial [Xanthomonadales bacterium]|nr:RHS repeat-associated core domain-containing protein [Xanthomonadales bacterium]
GYQKDNDTGLYYANARYYDANTGTFLREDPLFGNIENPPSLHRYNYAYANPTYYTDPTGQYGEFGHYYTTYYVALGVGYSANEARQLAAYSQFPDEVESYDATTLQARAIGDDFFGSKRLRISELDSQYWTKGRVEQRERTAIQQANHSLTGADSALETQRSIKSVLSNDDLAITGVAIHKLADSFAHRRIDDESKMYSTGWGHYDDGHAPDEIHLRPKLYEAYVNTLAQTLAAKRGLSPEEAEARIARVNKIAKVLTSSRDSLNPEDNKAVTSKDMLMLIRIADTEGRFERGEITIDFPENHNIHKGWFDNTNIGLADRGISRKLKSQSYDIRGWYEDKFRLHGQGLNINGQKNLKEEVLKDIAVLIGIDDYKALKSLDDHIVFDLVDQRLKHAINENIRSYDNQLNLEKVDNNTSVIIE